MIAVAQPMGCARASRCCDPKALAHTRPQVKYTIFEHVHSKGMKVCVAPTYERDTAYFFSIWIDSRLPHIRNRVTQRLIWLLKIEGLFVGMLLDPRFPGLLAHWVFFGNSRFGTTTDGKRLIVPVLLCYNRSYGGIGFKQTILMAQRVAGVKGWRCKQV